MNYFMDAMKAHNEQVNQTRTFFLILSASCVNPDTIAEAADKFNAELVSVDSLAYDELTSVEKSELYSSDIECIIKIRTRDMIRANAIRSAIRAEYEPIAEEDEEVSIEELESLR